jgi:cytochrome oxidase assembly protein ShyY1
VFGHVLVATVVAVFIALGFWQYERHLDQRRVERAAAAARDEPSFDVPEITAATDAADRPRVRASGTYDARHQFVVRGRVRGTDTGVGILTPIVLADGSAVLVDRGFVAAAPGVLPAGALEVPSGEVQVAGLARAAQSVQGDERAQPAGDPPTVDRVVPATIAAALPYPVLDAWIAMDAQDPAPPNGAPIPATPAAANGGGYRVNHLSYALQWWAFALIPLIGWPLVVRRAHHKDRRRASEADAPAELTSVR